MPTAMLQKASIQARFWPRSQALAPIQHMWN
ncbi:Uncharacterised protein [Bordetella avium]|nr:Uncharacterised protein [Bordetella avium]